ncbi:MAG: hypothetical protein DHS20C16_00530 [Phycisphaerae bacterium]|nr:MAG: hypothetical protein DHS20C16_00530 [Phycisphaerae bacterium]
MPDSRTTDAEYVESLAIQSRDAQLAIHIRRAIASMCSVDPEQLCAQDDAQRLNKKMKGWGSLGQIEFVMALEDSIGDEDVQVYGPNLERIPPLVGLRILGLRQESPANFGEWVVSCVKVLAAR